MVRALAIVLAVVIVGAAAFALGRRTDGRDNGRAVTLRQGDVVVVPATATRCEASHEGGIPNLFCTRTSRARYQVVFWRDEVQVYDLAEPHEPMEATFVVPATLKP